MKMQAMKCEILLAGGSGRRLVGIGIALTLPFGMKSCEVAPSSFGWSMTSPESTLNFGLAVRVRTLLFL
jgi:hypothetical protein